MQSQHHFSLRVPESGKADTASFSIGIPLSQGHCYVHQPLQCKRNDNQLVKCAFTPLAWWPDHSVKWLLLEGHTPVAGINESQFWVESKQKAAIQVNQEHVASHESDSTISLTTSNWACQLSKTTLFDGYFMLAGKRWTISFNNQFTGEFSEYHSSLTDWHVEPKYCDQPDGSPAFIHLTLYYELSAGRPDLAPIKLQVKLGFEPALGLARIITTITNTNPAEHNGGTWDLGDPRSVFIDNMTLAISSDQACAAIQVSPDTAIVSINRESQLWQRASGGARWDSPNHLNHARELSIQVPNTHFIVDGITQQAPTRPEPAALLTSQNVQLSVSPDRFWQNFPTSLAAEPGKISWSMFKAEPGLPVELQPGEQKTHSTIIQAASDTVAKAAIANATISADWLTATGVFPRLSAHLLNDPLQSLISEGLDGPSSFFAKREAIDEYGWRHFGDLYADHETDGYTGDTLFTSHYNNQYDPLLGFLKQWLISGDQRWRELADDLARHIIDIDIYHTELDKPEYNQGLFWHTDHYLPAETATHRTYSRHHKGNAYQDHAGGGGPGGQHCYTTGLQLYYFVTGCQAAQQAVLGLTDWITTVYEGDDTLFGLLLSYKNRYRIDLKNISTGTYPLDRGTANYMMALLDSFEITNDLQYLQQVSYIIRHTVSPDDNIVETRNLDNVENYWFYTVFLQAVCRYLDIQCVVGKNQDYYYAVACLVHYAHWMADNEYPYLEKPDILEYPNQTWSAQDLRKVAVLSIAATYTSEDNALRFRAKAAEIKHYVVNAISGSNEKHYTRILALLMQNYGIDTIESATSPTVVVTAGKFPASIQRDKGWKGYVLHVIKRLSVKREWQQLQKRVPTLRRKLS